MGANRKSGIFWVLARSTRVRPVFATRRIFAITTGLLFFIGGGLGITTISLVPTGQLAHPVVLYLLGTLGMVIGVLSIIIGRRWFPYQLVHYQVVGALVFITSAVACSGGGRLAIVLSFLYTIIPIETFFFFAWPIALGYLLLAQLCAVTAELSVGLGLADIVLPQGNSVALAIAIGWLVHAAAAAEVDPLTSLINRRGFDRKAHLLMTSARRSGEELAMVLLDLDDFKKINDVDGHAAGDRALREVSRVWTNALKNLEQKTVFARIGGDEFAVLLPGADVEAAQEVAQVLRAASAQRVSAGIARHVAGDSLVKFVSRADIALYESKSYGGGHTVCYSGEEPASADELHAALANGEFEVYFQPIVSLQDASITGDEALVRWNHPTRGLVSPDDFIPAAERSGAIIEMGNWILRTACRRTAELISTTGRTRRIAVNASGRELRIAGYADRVAAILAETGLAAQSLVIEVTETTFDADHPEVIAELRRVQELGVEIAIDDFGTGYSSLSRLDRLPADVIKIDRSFISAISNSNNDLAILKAIVALAQALGVRLVAEGVETAEHAEILRELGCTYAQGYYFGRPAPAQDPVAHTLLLTA